MGRATEGRRREKEEEVIWRAIRGRSCPICFRDLEVRYKEAAVLSRCKHAYCSDCLSRWSEVRRSCPLCNSEFNSWFYILSLSSNTFRKHSLPSHHHHHHYSNSNSNSNSNQSRLHRTTTRIVDRRRINNRRRLPWRRSFGRAGVVTAHLIAQRKLEWRASIYNQGLQPDPTTLRCSEPRCKGCSPCYLLISSPNKLGKDAVKKEILQRIEPWIRRELQAVLGDPDPTVIVHVVTSQFIAWLEEKAKLPSGQLDVRDNFILPLRPFLHDKTSIFWHELSCFAEGCYNMETYDAVVDYKQME